MNAPTRHLVTWAAVLSCALSCAAVPPAAGAVVIPPNVSIDSNHINLVGIWSRASDRWNAADSLAYGARVTVTVRDVSYNPIAGVPVTIDFSGCPGVFISNTQSYRGMTAACTTPTVQNYTTWSGTVSFVVVGSLHSRAEQAPACAFVFADNYFVGRLSVGVYDQTGTGGLTLADISYFWSDLNSGTYHTRSDLDGNGTLTLADISYVWAAYTSSFDASATTLCSNPPVNPPPSGDDPGPVGPGPKRLP